MEGSTATPPRDPELVAASRRANEEFLAPLENVAMFGPQLLMGIIGDEKLTNLWCEVLTKRSNS